jgi:hypothetical protein
VRHVGADEEEAAPGAGDHRSSPAASICEGKTTDTVGMEQTSEEENAEGVQRNEEVTRNSQEATAEEGELDGGRNPRRSAVTVAGER